MFRPLAAAYLVVVGVLTYPASEVRADPAAPGEEISRAQPPTQRSFSGWPPRPVIRRPDSLAAERIKARRQVMQAYRDQRELEREAARKAREADRTKWLERWEEQRRRAREESREREERYRQGLTARFPGLAAHRQRYSDELERRRLELDRLRQERWAADIDPDL